MSQPGSSISLALTMRYALTRDKVIRLRGSLLSISNKEDAQSWASNFAKAMVRALDLP